MSDIQQIAKGVGLPNWKLIAFALIFRVLRGKGFSSRFYRTELFSSSNLELAVDWSRKLGHKKHPEHPEETLQRTLQNMRDDYVQFLGQGQYRLTEKGLEVIAKFKKLLEVFVD